jgi:hypothetical protein
MANVSVIISYVCSMVKDRCLQESGGVVQGKFQGSPTIYNTDGTLSEHMLVSSWCKAICKTNKQLYLQFVMYTKAYVTCVKFTVS